MGLGDQLIGTGIARGARQRGKRIAFGQGSRIVWDHNSKTIFEGNPNIAAPGSEGARDLEWVAFYKGNRCYNRLGSGRWIWNLDFRCSPGEVYLSEYEYAQGLRFGQGFVLIEPNVPSHKAAIHNKQWPPARFQEVANIMRGRGYEVLQPVYNRATYMLDGVRKVSARSFRDMLAIMANARLYIGPEGGLHHGAAALGKPAVVLFGGFVPPAVTGYSMHINLTGGAEIACGMLTPCAHCKAALEAISVDQVCDAASGLL